MSNNYEALQTFGEDKRLLVCLKYYTTALLAACALRELLVVALFFVL